MPDLPLVKFSFYQGEERVLTGQVDVIGAHPSARAMGPQKKKAGQSRPQVKDVKARRR
jgi:hypothetical protein